MFITLTAAIQMRNHRTEPHIGAHVLSSNQLYDFAISLVRISLIYRTPTGRSRRWGLPRLHGTLWIFLQ